MGLFKHDVQVFGPAGDALETLSLWVDSGSSYTWIPERLLGRLDLQPDEERDFILANGSRQRRRVAQVRISLGGPPFYTYCAFAREGEELLLGAIALEEAGLAIDPVRRRLVSAAGYALTAL
jgi:predicted aspartyl protease